MNADFSGLSVYLSGHHDDFIYGYDDKPLHLFLRGIILRAVLFLPLFISAPFCCSDLFFPIEFLLPLTATQIVPSNDVILEFPYMVGDELQPNYIYSPKLPLHGQHDNVAIGWLGRGSDRAHSTFNTVITLAPLGRP
jgi:hypothetical protein